MDTTMIHLRAFVHQRLYTAAEEILGEVEKTITLAYEAEVSRAKEEAGSLRQQLDLLRKTQAAEPSLTSSTQVQLGDDGQTQEMVFLAPEIVESDEDKPETQVSYEMQPISSDCSAAQSENNDSDLELVNSKEEQNKTMKRKGENLQGPSGSVDEDKAESCDESSAKSEKDGRFCHLCGKRFHYIGSLLRHIKAHQNNFFCTVCGMMCQSTQELIAHLKSGHNNVLFCEICGDIFSNVASLQKHKRIHTNKKEFGCQECGKKFFDKSHLAVHVRTHSGEKPFHCDICGKSFSQSGTLVTHKRTHTGEKPYQCGLCGKAFATKSDLGVHMRYHTGEKPYACDFCGKRFIKSAEMKRHRTIHTGEKPHGCHICGKRSRRASDLKTHLRCHEMAAAEKKQLQ